MLTVSVDWAKYLVEATRTQRAARLAEYRYANSCKAKSGEILAEAKRVCETHRPLENILDYSDL